MFHRRIFILIVALATFVPTAHAADIARSQPQAGTTIFLTDDLPAECNRLNFHGGARMQRGRNVQRACWTFDWKRRVFTVMPLVPRKTSRVFLTGIAEALGVEREAAWIEHRLHGDIANKLSLPAKAFTWYGKQAAAGK
jgi:hypothetical protein